MEHPQQQPVRLAAFDSLAPSPEAIHEVNRLRMQQYERSLPAAERYAPLPEPPIRRRTVPTATRWINIVNR